MLYTAGATLKLGHVDAGDTITDYEEEEIERAMTLSTGVAHAEWGKTKINLLDTPGFNIFIHEARAAMVPTEAALVVVDGAQPVGIVTERVWSFAQELDVPRILVATRMDRERTDKNTVIESLQKAFGRQVVPVQLPIGSEKNLSGIVDLVTMKGYSYEMGGSGKGKEVPIPAEMAEPAKAAHEALVELVAEGKDELMEEFFEKGTIGEEHLIPAIHEAIRDDRLFPLLFASGLGNIGTDRLLDFLEVYAPTAAEHREVKSAPTANNGNPAVRHAVDTEHSSLFIFKTANDSFAGRITDFKVFSGVEKNDATVQNYTRNT